MWHSHAFVFTPSHLVLLASDKLSQPGWEAADRNDTQAVRPCRAKGSRAETPELAPIRTDTCSHLKCGPENNTAVLACLHTTAKEDYLWSCYTASTSGLTFFPLAWESLSHAPLSGVVRVKFPSIQRAPLCKTAVKWNTSVPCLQDSWLWRINNLTSCREELLFLCPAMSTINVRKTFSPVNPGFQSQASFFIVKIASFLVLCNYLRIKIETDG